VVPLAEYERTCAAIEAVLRQCRDTRTGEPVIETIERPGRDPMTLDRTEADIDVFWRGTVNAIEHPELGRIGPVPFRRPGGHTGETGVAYIAGEGIPNRRYGSRSSFDVVPTLIDLLGEPPSSRLTGQSFLPLLRQEPAIPAG
jgi:hypothetical protein